MRIAVLGASGKTGHTLVQQALERGHHVVALVRTPSHFTVVDERVDVRQVDVLASPTLPDAADADVAISAIGVGKGDAPGALIAGARALAATPVRTIWLGALGSGSSTGAGGAIYQTIMRMFVGKELAEKGEADQIALDSGATVFHAPDVTNGSLSPGRHIVSLADFARPFLPPRISRASLAALMLDEAENNSHAGTLVVPLA